ncbi:MAG: sigma-E processing peptidase SpoIIGA [Acutalibacteraceae bacterium]|nr:sigma-E processing peptidase SpoIIGA [Acutalibacteraceae bacterium]
MVIYADILVILNLIVDYMLLLVTGKIVKLKPPAVRQIAAALVGGLSALYIFLPNIGAFIGVLIRLADCAVMVLICFGFKSLKCFLRSCAVLMLVCFAYGGIMTAFWYLFKPNGMTVINSVVYFNISPAVLIGSSVTVYLLYTALYSLLKKNSALAERCNITVFAGDGKINMSGIIDTGNSIEDALGNSEVIITDSKGAAALFGNIDINSNEGLKSRYRLMPCGTVSGTGALEGFRCDRATVTDGKRTVELEKPILAVSKTRLNDDYQAIVNPKIFL